MVRSLRGRTGTNSILGLSLRNPNQQTIRQPKAEIETSVSAASDQKKAPRCLTPHGFCLIVRHPHLQSNHDDPSMVIDKEGKP